MRLGREASRGAQLFSGWDERAKGRVTQPLRSQVRSRPRRSWPRVGAGMRIIGAAGLRSKTVNGRLVVRGFESHPLRFVRVTRLRNCWATVLAATPTDPDLPGRVSPS